MSNIVKKVHRLVPPNQRSQTFTDADATTGDVIMVEESLGRPAQHVLIDANDPMEVRFNVYQYIFPFANPWDDDFNVWGSSRYNLTSGILIKDNDGVSHSIEGSSTLELDRDIPVLDIELLTVSGQFTITVM